MKINFQNFTVPQDIAGRKQQEVDARESFANLIYTRVSGIQAHALALKIYNSTGEVEYTDKEVDVIRRVAHEYCTPMFIDGLKQQLAE